MIHHANPDRIRLTLVPDGPGPPAAVRWRRWLKMAKRSHGLRCVAYDGGDPADDLAALRRLVLALAERVAVQSELLSRVAEREVSQCAR